MRGLTTFAVLAAGLALAGVSGEPVRALRPQAAPPGYGSWVDWLGDYDGDGERDLVIGAWGGGSERGGVQVILSQAGPMWIYGPELGDGFGVFAGSVGDVTGDGRDDLAVGAPYGRAGGAWDTGVLWVYSGELLELRSAIPHMGLTGELDSGRFGWSACGIGDRDGDGVGDLAVGAPTAHGFDGEVHLFGGSADGVSPWRRVVANDEVSKGEFGIVVRSVGDLNGDDSVDFAVGVPLKRIWQGGDPRLPQVWVYLGGAERSLSPSYKLYGTDWNRLFGWHLAPAGDVDGDGYGDLIVGAPRKRSAPPESWIQGTDQGKVWIYRGGEVPDTTPYVRLAGENPDDAFGNSVIGLGDIDRDGFADLAVGAPEHDTGGDNAGAVYLFRGGAPMDTVPDLIYRGAIAGARLGYSLSSPDRPEGAGPVHGAAGAIDGSYAWIYRFFAEDETEPLPGGRLEHLLQCPREDSGVVD